MVVYSEEWVLIDDSNDNRQSRMMMMAMMVVGKATSSSRKPVYFERGSNVFATNFILYNFYYIKCLFSAFFYYFIVWHFFVSVNA